MKLPPERDGPCFRVAAKFDVPELLGASWWIESNALTTARRLAWRRPSDHDASRRQALQRLLVIGGGIAGLGLLLGHGWSTGSNAAAWPPPRVDSTQLQRQAGWAVGAGNARLQFDDATAADIDGGRVDTAIVQQLASLLRPQRPDLVPFYAPTLFQAATHHTLTNAMVPICSAAMQRAFAAGAALADLFAPTGTPRDVALVVDLPGPEAIAFAAGAAAAFAPVCVFQNWPHPRGVVPAHLTFAAALYYRPRLMAGPNDQRMPAFVLDRARLSPYRDEPDRFDNRYLAPLPTAAQLRALHVARVLYVTPTDGDEALADVAATLADWRAAQLDVRALGADRFGSEPDAAATSSPAAAHYYGHPSGHLYFWHHYPWWSGVARPREPVPPPPRGAAFAPIARTHDLRALGRVGTAVDPSAPSPSPSGRSGSSGRGWFGSGWRFG